MYTHAQLIAFLRELFQCRGLSATFRAHDSINGVTEVRATPHTLILARDPASEADDVAKDNLYRKLNTQFVRQFDEYLQQYEIQSIILINLDVTRHAMGMLTSKYAVTEFSQTDVLSQFMRHHLQPNVARVTSTTTEPCNCMRVDDIVARMFGCVAGDVLQLDREYYTVISN